MTNTPNPVGDEKRLLRSLLAKVSKPDVKGSFLVALIPENCDREDVIRKTKYAIQSALPDLFQAQTTPAATTAHTSQEWIQALGLSPFSRTQNPSLALNSLTPTETPRRLVHITTLHELLQESGKIKAAQMMDTSREVLFSDIAALKILWLSEQSYKTLKLHAPNFCSWMSAAYTITGNFTQQDAKPTPPCP